ncbi:hypothetical protein JI752_006830 [Lysobacter sp. MMG2]|uniref:hypothetical protein n=1 Tax=Lysobacter sp. MMG2 TaxID=2801338 RepID=UPI001C246F32|nr:hypothetical protein [Lysobacter sp. MMG2]MBU8975854.1 hypothetical protein [Lysobacter sp. MMG2]
MPINFIPNDPLASKFNRPQSRLQLKNRSAARAGFEFGNIGRPKLYAVSDLRFLQWQVRQAALSALAAFESIDGAPLKRWASGKTLGIQYLAGRDINAYYNGEDLVFCQAPDGPGIRFTGASTDVVAHEVGHAILDALRPDLWAIEYLEVAAFHESFGDCLAILTALADPEIRAHITTHGGLGGVNLVETWGEHLSWLAGDAPRQARNSEKWSLPDKNDEYHDYSQIFTGCFYDLIRSQFEAGTRSAANLWKAAQSAGKLLFVAARAAPPTPRFYQAVGRAMALQAGQGTALKAAVDAAFERHGITLGSSAITASKAKIAGAIKKEKSRNFTLTPAAMADLRNRMGADDAAPSYVRKVRFGPHEMAEARFTRTVPLHLPNFPANSATNIPESVLVRAVGAMPARGRGASVELMSALPDAVAIDQEVNDFVASLRKRGQLQLAPNATVAHPRSYAARGAVASGGGGILQAEMPDPGVTHRLIKGQGGPLLERIRFSCACHRTPRR